MSIENNSVWSVALWVFVNNGLGNGSFNGPGNGLLLPGNKARCPATLSHYLKQCWHFVNQTIRNNIQGNLNHNTNISLQENPIKNIICNIMANFHMSVNSQEVLKISINKMNMPNLQGSDELMRVWGYHVPLFCTIPSKVSQFCKIKCSSMTDIQLVINP